MERQKTIQTVATEPGFSGRGNRAAEKRTMSAKPRISEHQYRVKNAIGGDAFIIGKRVGNETQFFDRTGPLGMRMPVAVLTKSRQLVFLIKTARPLTKTSPASKMFRLPRFLKECRNVLRGRKSGLYEFPTVIKGFKRLPAIETYNGGKKTTHTPVFLMGGESDAHVLVPYHGKILPVKVRGEMMPPMFSGNPASAKNRFVTWLDEKAGSLGLIRCALKKSLVSSEYLKRTENRTEETMFATSEGQLYARVKKAKGYKKTTGPSPYDGCKYVPVQEKPSTNTFLNQTVKCDGADVSQIFDLVKAKVQFGCIGKLGKLAQEEATEQVKESRNEDTEARNEVIRKSSERRAKRPVARGEHATGKTSQKQGRQATAQKQKGMYAGAKSRSRGMRTNKGGKGKLNRSKNEGFNRKRDSQVPKSARR